MSRETYRKMLCFLIAQSKIACTQRARILGAGPSLFDARWLAIGRSVYVCPDHAVQRPSESMHVRGFIYMIGNRCASRDPVTRDWNGVQNEDIVSSAKRERENLSNYALAPVLRGNRVDQSERCHVPGRASARG